MDKDQNKYAPTSETDRNAEPSERDQLATLIEQYAELGGIQLVVVPAAEYDDYQANFLRAFDGTDEELRDALETTHKNPVYSQDGSTIEAYQVYSYLDTSALPEETQHQLELLSEKFIELSANA